VLILQRCIVVVESAEKSIVQRLAYCRLTIHRYEPLDGFRNRLESVASSLSFLSFQTALFI
jgi:hypothetical protein